MTAPRIAAVCWDWNGTLLDDVELCLQVMNEVLGELGIQTIPDAAAYRSVFRFPIRDFYRDVGVSDESYERACLRYLELLEARTGEASLHEQACMTLSAVRSLGIRQILASATLPALLEKQLRPHGIAQEFDEILSIDDALRPSKRAVIGAWLDASGLAPASVLLIGDTDHDREIAEDLGAAFVHFSGGHQRHRAGATSVAQLDEVLAMLTRSAERERQAHVGRR